MTISPTTQLTDDYTTDPLPERLAMIPVLQRAARHEVEHGERLNRPLTVEYAQAVDDILSWLGGESDNLIENFVIRSAARGEWS